MKDLKPLKIKGKGEALKGLQAVAGIISLGVLKVAGPYVENECKKVVSPVVSMSSHSDGASAREIRCEMRYEGFCTNGESDQQQSQMVIL